VKVDKETLQIVLDEEFEDIAIDDLAEELPETTPRYAGKKKIRNKKILSS